jgi:ornithine cyclodeaminase
LRLLVLTAADVERLLPMADCIGVMEMALRDLALGQVDQPLRTVLRPEQAPGLMAFMPSWRGPAERGAFGVKVVGVFPGNVAKGIDSHQGAVLLFDGQTGVPLAAMNASAITALRTAAVSGVATRLLARVDAGDAAIVGAGVEARTHLLALACVRKLSRVRVASRSLDSARRFAAAMTPQSPVPIEAMASVEAAVRGADIVSTVTSAAEPVLRREWLKGGAHVNAVGASLPTRRELDGATLAAARLFVDRRESALNEAGDYLLAVKEGAIRAGAIHAELGEVITGRAAGRASDDEITVFKSLGLAIEDLACAQWLYARAQAAGAGSAAEF